MSGLKRAGFWSGHRAASVSAAVRSQVTQLSPLSRSLSTHTRPAQRLVVEHTSWPGGPRAPAGRPEATIRRTCRSSNSTAARSSSTGRSPAARSNGGVVSAVRPYRASHVTPFLIRRGQSQLLGALRRPFANPGALRRRSRRAAWRSTVMRPATARSPGGSTCSKRSQAWHTRAVGAG